MLSRARTQLILPFMAGSAAPRYLILANLCSFRFSDFPAAGGDVAGVQGRDGLPDCLPARPAAAARPPRPGRGSQCGGATWARRGRTHSGRHHHMVKIIEKSLLALFFVSIHWTEKDRRRVFIDKHHQNIYMACIKRMARYKWTSLCSSV